MRYAGGTCARKRGSGPCSPMASVASKMKDGASTCAVMVALIESKWELMEQRYCRSGPRCFSSYPIDFNVPDRDIQYIRT